MTSKDIALSTELLMHTNLIIALRKTKCNNFKLSYFYFVVISMVIKKQHYNSITMKDFNNTTIEKSQKKLQKKLPLKKQKKKGMLHSHSIFAIFRV